MESNHAKCPKWLADHLIERGGSVTFSQFMDWALNDPTNGSYSSGRIKIGIDGDFATSPSLSNDFAELLAIQLAEWFNDINLNIPSNQIISLVEIGPGEGDLSFDLLIALEKLCPKLIQNFELVLVEINDGMKARQKKKLSCFNNIRIRWADINELIDNPISGVILAHEVLDALPVERVVQRNNELYQIGVTLKEIESDYYIEYIDLPLTSNTKYLLEEYKDKCDLFIPPKNTLNGWNSEVHVNLDSWFSKVSSSLKVGTLLIIDYALEAESYYKSSRASGTIVSYRNQKMNNDVLREAGLCDITSHLCIETLVMFAEKNRFELIGETKQGLALLSLGLADRITLLRESEISTALNRRESLLRLVDPSALGSFRWLLFKTNTNKSYNEICFNTSFLEEPVNVNYH